MKLPNSYGSVIKLSGKRRKPYNARITVDCKYDEELGDYIQVRKSLGCYKTKAEALDALAKYNDNPFNIVDGSMTVDQIWNNIKDTVNVSEDRRQVYARSYKKYFEPIKNMRIKDVKTRHLQSCIDANPNGYSSKSIMRVMMHHIFKYAIKNDIVDKDYTDYIEFEQEEVQIERVLFTSEEIAKLWEHKELEEYAAAIILLHQGMRIKELRDTTKDWIDLDKKTIDIKIAKNKQSIRTIPINKKVLPLIKELYDKSPDEKLLHLRKNQYERFVKTVLGHTPYDTRHTFASKAKGLKLETVVIQRIMGHKPETLLENVYIHLSIEELSEAINQVVY